MRAVFACSHPPLHPPSHPFHCAPIATATAQAASRFIDLSRRAAPICAGSTARGGLSSISSGGGSAADSKPENSTHNAAFQPAALRAKQSASGCTSDACTHAREGANEVERGSGQHVPRLIAGGRSHRASHAILEAEKVVTRVAKRAPVRNML